MFLLLQIFRVCLLRIHKISKSKAKNCPMIKPGIVPCSNTSHIFGDNFPKPRNGIKIEDLKHDDVV